MNSLNLNQKELLRLIANVPGITVHNGRIAEKTFRTAQNSLSVKLAPYLKMCGRMAARHVFQTFSEDFCDRVRNTYPVYTILTGAQDVPFFHDIKLSRDTSKVLEYLITCNNAFCYDFLQQEYGSWGRFAQFIFALNHDLSHARKTGGEKGVTDYLFNADWHAQNQKFPVSAFPLILDFPVQRWDANLV